MCYAVSAVTVAATVIATSSFCIHAGAVELEVSHLTDAEIDGLGPMRTALELLAARRRLMERR
jgi:hypothetical protein